MISAGSIWGSKMVGDGVLGSVVASVYPFSTKKLSGRLLVCCVSVVIVCLFFSSLILPAVPKDAIIIL